MRAVDTNLLVRLLALEVARQAGHLPLGTFDKALARLEGAERA
jgi:predicted nucleic acid-binding protein